MNLKRLNNIFLFGAIAFIAVLALQIYWIVFAWQVKTNDFKQRVNFSLRKVAEQMAVRSGFELPKTDLIKEIAHNEFLVNYNYEISLDILEDFLIREMDVVEPGINFEFGVYDCFTNDLVFGSCCELEASTRQRIKEKIPTHDNLTYYFVVRFPDKNVYLLTNLKFFVLLGLFTIIVGISYLFAIKALYKQKKISELQKDFVDNMTHEFKTPLTSIKLASNVLLENDAVNENSKLKKYTEIIVQQSEKLTSHVERLLDLVRSERTFSLKIEKIDLKQMILQINSDFMEKTSGSVLNFTEDFPDEDIFIEGDRYHLFNAFQNIYDNSIKYNNKDVKSICTSIKEMNDSIRLEIKDNGIGIAAENIPYIFEKFYRVQKNDIHDVKGFGLGLYYVKNILDLHKWKINVESKLNEFTSFTIIIYKYPNGNKQ
jgi:two-component system, OmpR family, phosphate regulon sensor histidine kinase PhoR